MGRTVQRVSIIIETKKPRPVPKKDLNTAPVYPNSAEISNFSKISVLERSMGLNIVAISEKVSKGYSSNTIKDIKNRPS